MSDHKLDEELKISCAEPVPNPVLTSAPDQPSKQKQGQDGKDCGTDIAEIEERIGKFRLEREIEAGALGRLFLAKNDCLEGQFAVRIISPLLYADKESEQRLIDSLQNAQTAVHPHLAGYYDCGRTENGSIYFVSDYVKGKSLSQLLEDGVTFDASRFMDIFRQLCQALKVLHARQIIHGNLKPGNVFLMDRETGNADYVKLGDYAICGTFSEKARQSYLQLSCKADGASYLSPEQVLNFGLDLRSDIYALGLLMYEMLNGKPLVKGHSQMHTMLKQLNFMPDFISETGELPAGLEKILLKCLEKNRANRYFSIEDLEMDLDLAASDLSGLPGLSSQAAFSQKQKRNANGSAQSGNPEADEKKRARRRRRRRLVLYGVLSAVAVSGISFYAVNRHDSTYFENQAEIALNNAISIPFSNENGPLPDNFNSSFVPGDLLHSPPGATAPPLVLPEPLPPGATPSQASSPLSMHVPEAASLPDGRLPGLAPDAFAMPPVLQGAAPGLTTVSGALAAGAVPALGAQPDRGQLRWQQRQFERAERFAKRAILAYRVENLFRSDMKFKHRLSDLQLFLGELYLRDQFAEQGGRFDRASFMSVSDYIDFTNGLASVKLYPSFPGLFPSQKSADYKDAEIWFDKAAKTLGRKYCGNDMDLLWDMAYTKFQLGKIGDAIDLHHVLMEAAQKQKVVDKNILVMAKRNIGLLYLWNGNWGDAVHYLKLARKEDQELNKVPAAYSDQLRVELAYAFLKEGKFDVAEKLAKENLDSFEKRNMLLAGSYSQAPEFNFKVLAEALRLQGKSEEAMQYDPGAAL